MAALQQLSAGVLQSFTGTNAPNTYADFTLNVTSDMTNMSLVLPGNSGGFSHVMLRRGVAPSDALYDFSSKLDAGTNAIHMERPEVSAGTYYVRVKTPANSARHVFTLTFESNSPNVRSAERPVSKPLGAVFNTTVLPGQWQHFRLEPKTNIMWRAAVDTSSSTASPDLYVQTAKPASTSSYLERSTSATNDVIAVNGSLAGYGGTYYFIGLLGAGGPVLGANCTVRLEAIMPKDLAWDPGEKHIGTKTYTNQTALAGDYYFRIKAGNPSLGAWRTALRLFNTNGANLYMSSNKLPTPSDCNFKSEQPGSKGFILALGAQFNPDEEWFIMVRAKAGAAWSIVSGDPYVENLGSVPITPSQTNEAEIGPEGVRFFSASAPPGMLAWRLWLNGATNLICLKTNRVPLLPMQQGKPTFTGSYDIAPEPGQMLVVPPYLGVRQYIVGVPGTPGTKFTLDSRHQHIDDIFYQGATNLQVSGFPYQTFRVTVPSDQFAWQLYLTPTNGNPNLAVRRTQVPNISWNDAFSEQAGLTPDYLTLVPPMLSDGTFYVTVYNTNSVYTNMYRYTLQSRRAPITEIPYTSAITNDEPTRVGWKYYIVHDDRGQLSSLGWDLLLTNYAPGTRIAIRRSMAPSFWNYRQQGSVLLTNCYEQLSNKDFLQNPDQMAGTWYIGILNPSQPLGPFVLTTREIQATPLAENQAIRIENSLPGRWEFFSAQLTPDAVSPDAPGGPVEGWDVRLKDVVSGNPTLVIRRERLPVPLSFAPGANPLATNWPSGAQWWASEDWTKREINTDGINEEGRIIAMAAGRPWVPATYYIGVLDKVATNNSSYTILSRYVGKNKTIPVETLPMIGGRATGTVAAREAKYYKVQIPRETLTWRVRLTMDSGEGMLVICTNWMPTTVSERRVQKLDKEHYLLLPNASGYIDPGTYYIAVVGEGILPSNANTVGAGESTFTLETLGPLPVIDLGLLPEGGEVSQPGSAEGGTSVAYRFRTGQTSLGVWVTLSDAAGNPVLLSAGGAWPDPGIADRYGNDGGTTAKASSQLITMIGPGERLVLVKACALNGQHPSASFTINVKDIVPEELPFEGSLDVRNRPLLYDGYYYVDVPPNAMGWDLRITNVISGFPGVLVCKDGLPDTSGSFKFSSPFSASFWAPGMYVDAMDHAPFDWTGRNVSPEGLYEPGRILVFTRNRPLQQGRYYIRVINRSTESLSYTLVSRGIGSGLSVPVERLEFAMGQARKSNLPAHEADYYSVEVPEGARSWKVQLSATSGESLLMVLKDTLPNVRPGFASPTIGSGGRRMQKMGDEHFLLLPPAGQSNLAGGTYYVAVASEGQDVTNSVRIGYGTSSYTLTSFGEASVTTMGTVSSSAIVKTQSLAGGESRIYQFTVPAGIQNLEVSLDNRVGDPCMSLRVGDLVPYPGAAQAPVVADPYGNEGGEPPGVNVKRTILTMANPTNGVYTLIVKARGSGGESTMMTIPDAAYVLRISANDTVPLEFNEGMSSIVDHRMGPMRFFKVQVPTNAAGWDLRLINVDSRSAPKLVVRREKLPDNATTLGWSTPGTTSSWPTNNQWVATFDWTKRTFSPAGTSEDGRILAVGMKRPLEPGTYYVAVTNSSSFPASYTVYSRGIGDGFSIPIQDLAYAGGSAQGALMPREAAYYRVVVPSNSPSWKVQLTNTMGETMLGIYKSYLPNADTVAMNGTVESGKGMQRSGAEQFVMLPNSGLTNIPFGTNYIIVIGEGRTPSAANRIGTESSSYSLVSFGQLPVSQIGSVSSEDIVRPDTLFGGEVKAYRFNVPPRTYGFRVLLEERTGNPVAFVRQGERLPDPSVALPNMAADPYGNEGGYASTNGHNSIFTMANPLSGPFTMVVKARPLANVPSSATYTMRVQEILCPEMNFSADQNSNGLSHEKSALLQDNERVYYKVEIPAELDGEPILGWKLELSQTSGQALMRVAREVLPSDLATTSQMPFASATAVIAPPYLTNGTWFIEVKAVGSTFFRLVSKPLELQRPSWAMPLPGQPPQTPGVTEPEFADTAVSTNGTPNESEGILLEQGAMHYYAVDVPEGNLGLFRAELRPVNGQPVMYLREGAVPTLNHSTNGGVGILYDRTVMARTNTAYVNWVPLNGRTQRQLTPGKWYIAIKAGGNSHAYYRLKLGTGNIRYTDMSGQQITNVLAADDWSYYRIEPGTALPISISVSFSREYGEVEMRLRDTVPPGNGASNNVIDWDNDDKNTSQAYTSYPNPGTYTFNSPPVRPGQPLYIGFRAKNQSKYSVQVTSDVADAMEPTVVPFYGGSVALSLEPYASAIIRVDVPPEATRWRHLSQHLTNIMVYMEQGALPTRSKFRWSSTTSGGAPLTNSSYNVPLVTWDNQKKTYVSTATNWPWVPSQAYFLLVTNASAAAHDFFLQMDGRNALLTSNRWDDNDSNELPDVWEFTNFGSTGVPPDADPDKDGVSTAQEFDEGTLPMDSLDFMAQLDYGPVTIGGTVTATPARASYSLGSTVVLMALPDPGFSFIRWTGDASGSQNSISIYVTGHKRNLLAEFKGAGDDLITALPLFGDFTTAEASNIGFTKEAGEPSHAGNRGGKSIWWNWTAPQSGSVTISTAGSTFNTLLAVYTGADLSSLALRASDNNSLGGTNRSRVTFDAQAGETYYIAVDGFDGASARIRLALSMSGAVAPTRLARIAQSGANLQFHITGQPNKAFVMECSEDLLTWTVLKNGTIPADGVADLTDVPPADKASRFYRIKP